MKSYLIKVYHNFSEGKQAFVDFFEDVNKTLPHKTFRLGLHYLRGESFFSCSARRNSTYKGFESQFYTHFKDFQLTPDTKGISKFKASKTVLGVLRLENDWFYPFKLDTSNNTDFVFNMFRTFENFDIIQDRVGIFLEATPILNESMKFYLLSSLKYFWFKIKLLLQFFKYMFNFKIQKDWKKEGHDYYKSKLNHNLFEVKLFIVFQSSDKATAKAKVRTMFNNYKVFKNYPQNQFKIKFYDQLDSYKLLNVSSKAKKLIFSSLEISNIFHFPKNPKTETSLLTIKARKLALPIGIPTYKYTLDENREVIAKDYPNDVTILWITDYRSITVPIWLYDEDRLRHIYVVGQTGVGKSKFMQSLMISDIKQGKGISVIDPHGDLIEEIIQHIPESRMKDVVMFDPTDEEFPFCFNPLDVKATESKQILAKWFIDIFHKFFGANWNAKLEHVLRMIFLALLDKKDSTLFDIIRALTDKDFRYEMIDAIDDDVVRNFWTNEFAWWSQQFNTEAIMPILNKVGQLLSIDILKNIFASPENRLDLREVMDNKKMLLIKLPKGKLQEEIMGFLGAMFITKMYQTAMGRQWLSKAERIPFFLYVDEFQNFATETFSEILSEARKYGLGLCVAHQFIRQIPANISNALFGNVWTKVSFRISSDDAEYMKQHFDPFLDGYDLANLNMREFYCKTMTHGQVKDPFSLRSIWTPDAHIDHDYIQKLREVSRAKYCRTKEEAKVVVQTEQKEVLEKLEDFAEPLI